MKGTAAVDAAGELRRDGAGRGLDSPARRRLQALRTIFGALAIGLTCSDSVEPPVPSVLEAASVTDQQANVGSAVGTPPAVMVRDQNGSPMAGVSVTFEVIAGAGTVTPATVASGGDGIARLSSWTLGTIAGPNAVRASLGALSPVVFSATGIFVPIATSVTAATATTQNASVSAGVADPPGVLVRDQNNNPMAGVTVAFAVTAGGGNVTPPSVQTGANGVARVTAWTVGASPGTNTVTATVTGLGTVTFTANASAPVVPMPTTVQAVTATSQTVGVNTAVADPPGVLVLDQNSAPMAGVAVGFAVTAGGGSATPGSVQTGADGIARISSWTTGPTAGVNTLSATVGSLTPVIFSATAIAATPTTIEATTAVSQAGFVNTAVADPPGVLVRDQNGQPMQGVMIAFAVSGGGGAVAPSSVVTGPTGIARVTSWTLGSTPGANTVVAFVGSLSVTFTANAGLISFSMEAASATQQQTLAGTSVPAPPSVRVRDNTNALVEGVTVAFLVTSGGGSITPSARQTDANGIATLTTWTLGGTPGANSVTATVAGAPPVTFFAIGTAEPSVATSIQAASATSQQAPAGSPVGEPPAVLVRDQNNVPMAGVTVTFAIIGGGGSAAPATVLTDSDGVARLTVWTLGAAPGANALTGSVQGLLPVTFTATGTVQPASIQAVSAQTQSGFTGMPATEAPSVIVRDNNGAPLGGVTVAFTVTSGGGAIAPATRITDLNGIATASSWLLGANPGPQTASAAVTGLPPVTFTANAVTPALTASSIEATTPSSQEGVAGSPVSQPPAVRVRDQNNAPLPGVSVAFAVTAGDGAVSPAAALTDADGIARVTTWTLGPNAGANTLSATVSGLLPLTFSATGALVPSSVQGVSAQNQNAAVGTPVAEAPTVIVRDQNGAPLAGVTVSFAVTGGGGSVSPGIRVTGTDGRAAASTWTMGSAPGPNTLTASVAGLPAVTFTAAGFVPALVPTAIERVSQASQQAAAGAAVADPPAVLVRDQNNAPLPGVSVAFAVVGGGGSVSPASVVTGTDGIARLTSWTLGAAPGANAVNASASGLSPVMFSATGVLVVSSLQAVTATNQTVPVSGAVGVLPGVIVRDQFANPMQGITVTFAVTAGGGSVNPTTRVTGTDGLAQVTSWTVGASAGSNTLTATVTGVSPVAFTATSYVPVATSMAAMPGMPVNQVAAPNTSVAFPPGVIVLDQTGLPMAGATVAFAVTAGGGTVTPGSVVTGPDGIAQTTSWILANVGSTQTVTATLASLAPVTFNAQRDANALRATSIAATTPVSQSTPAGTSVSSAPGVVVRDQFGDPMAGVSVSFTVTAGGGSVSPSSVATAADGTAQLTSWTLGNTGGSNSVNATVAGLSPVTFSATGTLIPASVQAATVTTQQAPAGQAAGAPPGVIVRDQNGNPLAGVTVTFSVTGGGGSIVPAGGATTTGVGGVASLTSWTLGTAPGPNSVSAAVAGFTPVVFNATGIRVATSIVAVTSTSQSAPAGTSVTDPPGVRVLDQTGAGMQGVGVNFAVTGGGGVVSPAMVTSGADGVSRVTSWTLGSAGGSNSVTATLSGATPVVFSATGLLIATSVQAVSATTQQAPATSAVADPPAVIVRDQNGSPLAGVTVAFAASTGGTVAPASVVTGGDGVARLTSWTLSAAPGANTATATVSGLSPVTFFATGTLVASSIQAASATTQQAPAGSTVAAPPRVIVRDQSNNPMAGVSVAFAVTAGGGTVNPANVVTGSDGIAALTSWTLGAAGQNTVTATVSGLSPVTFSATGILVASAIEAVTSQSQQAPAGSQVAEAPGVRVRDQNDAPLAGVTVTFAVTAGGGSVSPASVVTGADGIARLTTWTLGTGQGSNTVTASAATLSPVTFTAIAMLVPTSVQAFTPTSQQAPTGTGVSQPPGVTVRDQNGNPMSGVTVSFAVIAGGGSITPSNVLTAADGTARLSSWTLGTAAGTNTVRATVTGLAPVNFNATGVLVVSSVQAITSTSQQALAGGAVDQPPGVLVRDQNSNPMAGVTVAFAVTGGGGSISPGSVVTGADGIGRLTSWTLGNAPGSNSVTATVTGLTPVSFSATGVLAASSLEAVSATSQQGPAGSAVADPPGVRVRDQNGSPLSGVAVFFAVTAGGGSVTPGVVNTGADGVARVTTWTLGLAAGTNTVAASVSGISPVTFTATAVLTASGMEAVTPTSQTALAGSAVAQPPAVIVRNQLNNPVAGVTVTFTITAGGGSRTPASVVTGSDGRAQLTSWALGASGGLNTLTASASGLPTVTFNATALAAASIQRTTAASQQALRGTVVPQPPGVVVRDQNGDVLAGVTVTFSVTAGGGSVTPSNVVTGADGVAQLTTWTLGSSAGTNAVNATVTALSPVSFTAVALAPATVQAVTALTQQGATGAPVSQPPGVIVRDQNGDPLPGISVAFAVSGGGGSVAPASVVSGSDGIARLTSWTLGLNVGTNTVNATVTGLSPVTFTATGALVASSATAASTTSQQATVNTAVATPPAVLVRDQHNNPLPAVNVTFSVTAGGGSLTPATVATGADGIARLTSWTVGPAGGANTVTAAVGTLAPVTFNATGLAPTTIQIVAGDGQTALAGADVAIAPAVRVRDQNGNPLPGIVVNFAVTAGNGSVAPLTRTTGADGIAATNGWTLGEVGTNTLSVSTPGLTPVTFTATATAPPAAVATSVQAVTGTSQTGLAGRMVSDLPGVIVRDAASAPLAGVLVTFAVTAGGGSISPTTKLTGSDGIARLSSWVLGTAPGTNTVTATVSDLTPVAFNATGTVVASLVGNSSPATQQAAAGSAVSQPPTVLVFDQNNNRMAGVTVTFAVTSGGGAISPLTRVTDANGSAGLTSWTLGSVPGTNTVTATVAGLPPVTFSATGIRVPASVQAASPASQNALVGTAVAQPPAVTVFDQNNQPLEGVTVTFAVGGGGGSIQPSPPTVVTGSNGKAQLVSWTLGANPGPNSVTATVSGLAPVTFNATGLSAASVQAVTSVSQQSAAGAPVPQAPGVVVLDQNSNPLSGVTVAFAVTGGGGSVAPPNTVTGADGIARATSWTLGTTPGSNTLTATVAGNSPVTFTATGTLVATSIAAASATTQTAPAGAPVTELPVAVVRDQFGNLMQGVTVTFAVTSGGGAIAPATAVTAANGMAALTNWTLGSTPGTNTVTASVAGLSPLTFSATGIRVPGSVQAITPTTQRGGVGLAAPLVPAVVVRDQFNQLLPNANVMFTVTAGGGTAVPASQLTDASGVSQLTRWTLGPTPATNTLTATVQGLPPVTFTAQGVQPTTVQAVTATTQESAAGATVPQAPGVLVRDPQNNPIHGVPVTFAITSGGGSLTPAVRLTGADGIAQLTSWTLGTSPGSNSVTATVSALTPVTFQATGVSLDCPEPTPISMGASVTGSLGSAPCRLATGEFVQSYVFSVTSNTVVRVRATSNVFDPYALIFRSTGQLVGENNDADALNAEVDAFLVPGTYFASASSSLVGETGPFTISLQPGVAAVTDCRTYFIMRGITTSQTLNDNDCNELNRRADVFVVFLQAGETVNVQMNSSQVNSYLTMMRPDGSLIENDNKAQGTQDAQIITTAPVTGYYLFSASTASNNQTGAYTLIVQ